MDADETLPDSLINVMDDPVSQAALVELQKQEAKTLPLLAGEAAWNPASHRFGPSSSLRKLENAIKEAQASGIGIDIDVHNCSWVQVRDARARLEGVMQRAKESYEAKGTKNVFRLLLRKGSIFNQVAAPFASLIPDQMGLNVLRAGLGILFAAMERRESNREKIFNTFEDIGIILEDAEELANPKVSPFGPEIQREVVELYVKVLEGLPKLLRVVDPRSTGHGHDFLHRAISHLAPSSDTTTITEITDSTKKAYDRLQQHVTAICQRSIAKLGPLGAQMVAAESKLLEISNATYQVATRMDSNMDVMKKKQDEMNEKIDELKTMGSSISRSEAALLEGMEQMKSIHEQSLTAVEQMVKLFTTALNGVFQNGCDMQRSREYYNDMYQDGQYTMYSRLALDSPRKREPMRTCMRKPRRLTSANILRAIGTPNPLILHQDVINVLSDGTTMEEDVLRRGRWLFTIPRFRAWLTDQQSDYLFVDGDCSSSISPRTSALSIVCASLLGALGGLNDQQRHTIALGFFCGEHFQLNSDDSDTDSPSQAASGPLGILRSLIAQLITYPRTPVWRFDGRDSVETDLESNGRQAAMAMIRILRTLIGQLPRRTTVYVIIDNLSEYEGTLNADWDEAMNVLGSRLIEIGDTMDERGIHVKTLLTCVSRCLALENALDLGNEFQDYDEDSHHISLCAGDVDSRAGVASAFEGDLQDLFTPSEPQSDSE